MKKKGTIQSHQNSTGMFAMNIAIGVEFRDKQERSSCPETPKRNALSALRPPRNDGLTESGEVARHCERQRSNPAERSGQIVTKTVVIVLLLFTGISGLWAKGNGETRTAGKIVAGYQPGSSSTLPMLAVEEGYFTREGVDAEFLPFSSTADGLAALEVGKLDVGVSFGTSAPLTLITNGAPFVIIAGNQTGSHPIFTKAENAALYRDVSGFKGKIVGTPRLFTSDVVFRGALYDAGLEPGRDLEVIEFKRPVDVLEAVKSGKVDVGVGSTAITAQIHDAGLAVPLYTTDLFPHHPCCRIVTTKTILKNKRPALVAFIKGLLLAEKKFGEDPESAVLANINQQNFSEQNAREITFAPHVELAIDPNTNAVVGMFERMKAIAYLNPGTALDPYTVIDTSLYREALEQIKKESPSPYWDTLSTRFADQNT